MSDAWAVQVSAGPVEMRKPCAGGKYCVFTFVFRIGAVNHRLVERYSILRNFHSRLSVGRKNIPSFPPKSWLFHRSNDVQFQEKRKKALLYYFKALAMEPYILKLEIFHTLLRLPANLKRKMVKIAEDLDSKKYTLEQHLGSDCDSGFRKLKEGNSSIPPDLPILQHKADERLRKEASQVQERERINNLLKDIHKEFKRLLPEKVQDDQELHNEADELMHNSKIMRYEKAVRDYRIFSYREIIQ